MDCEDSGAFWIIHRLDSAWIGQGLLLSVVKENSFCGWRSRLRLGEYCNLWQRHHRTTAVHELNSSAKDKSCRQDFRSFAIPLQMLRKQIPKGWKMHCCGVPWWKVLYFELRCRMKLRRGCYMAAAFCIAKQWQANDTAIRSKRVRKPKFEQPIFGRSLGKQSWDELLSVTNILFCNPFHLMYLCWRWCCKCNMPDDQWYSPGKIAYWMSPCELAWLASSSFLVLDRKEFLSIKDLGSGSFQLL
jgi:hypothetical protein